MQFTQKGFSGAAKKRFLQLQQAFLHIVTQFLNPLLQPRVGRILLAGLQLPKRYFDKNIIQLGPRTEFQRFLQRLHHFQIRS
ncbi:hypothetical protein D3C75_775140 [compost metagenome]